MRIKKGDNVIVIAGKDKGRTGKIERILGDVNKVIIPGLNLTKFHQKPNKKDQKGQLIEKSMPINASNVMIIDGKTQKPTRIGRKLVQGSLKRYSKRSGNVID